MRLNYTILLHLRIYAPLQHIIFIFIIDSMERASLVAYCRCTCTLRFTRCHIGFSRSRAVLSNLLWCHMEATKHLVFRYVSIQSKATLGSSHWCSLHTSSRSTTNLAITYSTDTWCDIYYSFVLFRIITRSTTCYKVNCYLIFHDITHGYARYLCWWMVINFVRFIKCHLAVDLSNDWTTIW